ncbi:MAG: hypothetical protein ACK5SR_00610 [Burkholderiales bacterium]
MTPRLQTQAARITHDYQNQWKQQRTTGWEEPEEYEQKRARSADVPDTGRGVLPAWAQRQKAQDSGFYIGQNVRHAKFGEGVIVNLEGRGTDARAQISFGRAGTKWLALGVAKLEAA